MVLVWDTFLTKSVKDWMGDGQKETPSLLRKREKGQKEAPSLLRKEEKGQKEAPSLLREKEKQWLIEAPSLLREKQWLIEAPSLPRDIHHPGICPPPTPGYPPPCIYASLPCPARYHSRCSDTNPIDVTRFYTFSRKVEGERVHTEKRVLSHPENKPPS